MQCKGEVSMSQHYPQQLYPQQPMYQQPFQGQQYPQQYGPEQPLSSYPLDGPGQLFQQPAPPRMQSWPQQPMSLPPGYQQPMLYQQQQYAAPPMMSTNVNVQIGSNGPGMLVRILYFLFVGWWVGLFWLNIGFALCALIVTLPLGLIMLNRLPQVITLKPVSQQTSVNVSTVAMQPGMGPALYQQNINISVNPVQQYNFFIRALYYIFIGCWVGYLWAMLAYLCCCTLVLLPVGVMMFDRLPMVLTLRKN
jgi:uncharacterized membrane protein YccF (DUF307 family)